MRKAAEKNAQIGSENDLEVLWELFERTGSVQAYLLFHDAKKNADAYERARSDVQKMQQDFGE